MAALVAINRHLWTSLTKMQDRVIQLDSLISLSGLFGDAVDVVIKRFQEARRQAAAYKRYIPRHHRDCGAARWGALARCRGFQPAFALSVTRHGYSTMVSDLHIKFPVTLSHLRAAGHSAAHSSYNTNKA